MDAIHKDNARKGEDSPTTQAGLIANAQRELDAVTAKICIGQDDVKVQCAGRPGLPTVAEFLASEPADSRRAGYVLLQLLDACSSGPPHGTVARDAWTRLAFRDGGDA